MLELMHHGGPGMWAILILGLVTVATAAWFAWRAEARVRGFLDQMGRSVAYAMLVSVSLDVMATLYGTVEAVSEHKGIMLMRGLGESMSPLVLGAALLSTIHLLTAIGQRRLDAKA